MVEATGETNGNKIATNSNDSSGNQSAFDESLSARNISENDRLDDSSGFLAQSFDEIIEDNKEEKRSFTSEKFDLRAIQKNLRSRESTTATTQQPSNTYPPR